MSIKRILLSVGIIVGTFSAIGFTSAATWTNLPVDSSGNVIVEPTGTLSGALDVSKPNASGTWTYAFSNDGNYLDINTSGTIPGTSPVPYNIILQNCPPVTTTSTQVTSSSWECALSQAENFPDGSRTFVDWDTEYYPTGTNPFIASGWFDNMRGTSSILLPFVVNFNDGSVNQTALKIYPASSTSASKEYAEFNLGTNGQLFVGTSPTSTGAFVVNQNGGNTCAGIYDSGAATIYGFADSLPAPSGCTALGGYYHGLAIGGNTSGTASPIFGVLNSSQSSNGRGHTGFTIYDNNEVDTFNNELDDGSGNAFVAGTFSAGGTSTAPVVSSTKVCIGNVCNTSWPSGSGGASTTTANTWSAIQTFGAGAVLNGNAYLGASTTIYAVAPTSTDVGTYLNSLCNTYAPQATSSANIMLPAMVPPSASWTVPILMTQRCNFIGVGIGTHLTWGGSGKQAVVEEFNSASANYAGGGLQNMWIDNAGSATTTNPIYGLTLGSSTAYGDRAFNAGLVISNFGINYDSASNTYETELAHTTLEDGGIAYQTEPSDNSGESLDQQDVSAFDCKYTANNCVNLSNGSIENFNWNGGVIDDSQLNDGNANYNVHFSGITHEEANYAYYGNYDFVSVAAPGGYPSTFSEDGSHYQLSAPATSTPQAEVVKCLDVCVFTSDTVAASGTSTPTWFSNASDTVDGKITLIGDQVLSGVNNTLYGSGVLPPGMYSTQGGFTGPLTIGSSTPGFATLTVDPLTSSTIGIQVGSATTTWNGNMMQWSGQGNTTGYVNQYGGAYFNALSGGGTAYLNGNIAGNTASPSNAGSDAFNAVGNVLIGNNASNATTSVSLQVQSSTFIGVSGSTPLCLEGTEAGGTSTKVYGYYNTTPAWVVTTTKPFFCQ